MIPMKSTEKKIEKDFKSLLGKYSPGLHKMSKEIYALSNKSELLALVMQSTML
jgi:hypothetical protein